MKGFLVAALALLTVSCATLPHPDETTAGVFIIPVEPVNSTDSDFGFYFNFVFEPIDADGARKSYFTKVVPVAGKYGHIEADLPEGTYRIVSMRTDISPTTTRWKLDGASKHEPLDSVISIENGKVTVWNQKLVVVIEEKNRSISGYYYLDSLDDEVFEKSISRLVKYKNHELYSIERL